MFFYPMSVVIDELKRFFSIFKSLLLALNSNTQFPYVVSASLFREKYNSVNMDFRSRLLTN